MKKQQFFSISYQPTKINILYQCGTFAPCNEPILSLTKAHHLFRFSLYSSGVLFLFRILPRILQTPFHLIIMSPETPPSCDSFSEDADANGPDSCEEQGQISREMSCSQNLSSIFLMIRLGYRVGKPQVMCFDG